MKGYYNVSGNKWFEFVNKSIETLLPMKENRIKKSNNGVKSIDILGDKTISICSRVKCIVKILAFIFIPILIILLVRGVYVFFSKTITVYSLYEFVLAKPFVNHLTIGENCGNIWFGGLKLSGYKKLKSLTIQRNSFRNVKSLEIFNNPLLESFIISNGGLLYDRAFENLNDYVIIRGRFFSILL